MATTPRKAAGKPASSAGKKQPQAPARPRKASPAKAPAKPVVTAPVPQSTAKDDKPKKPKLVRDSFTIPKDEYAVLDALKQRAAKLGRPAKKSEVLRAGVQALAAMPDSAFLAAVGGVPALKTGRPAKSAS